MKTNNLKLNILILQVSTIIILTILLATSCSTTNDLSKYYHHKSYNKQVNCYNFTK